MKPVPGTAGRHLIDGTFRVLLAEALFPLTALIVAGFLTRRLGPEDYGLLILAATLISWLQWSINAIFARATIKLVSDATDWRPIGSAALRLQIGAGLIAMIVLWLLAFPLARLLDVPALGSYLLLFSLDLPLFCAAQAHRHLLVGCGAFPSAAFVGAGRWIARLLLIVLLVELGLSVMGAILGSLGASLIELVIARRAIQPSFAQASSSSIGLLRGYTLPLSLSALSLSLYSRLDLFALKALGGSTVDAGIYGAAQNLSLLPNVFALSFSPLLLSTLSRLHAQGELDHAGEVGRQALRAVVGLLPFAALIAASAEEVITVLFGSVYAAGAPLLAVLIFGSVSVVMISIVTAILTAAGQPYRTLALAAPLVPIAAIGHITAIPSMGPLGAAAVTSLVAAAGAAAAVLVVYRSWQIAPAAGTICRSLAVSAGVFAAAAAWPTPGWDVFLKLGVLGFGIPLAFWALGEFDAHELALARSFISRTARVRPYIQGA